MQTAYMPLKAQRVISSDSRFKVLEGGRGSAKSISFADALLVRAAYEPLRILCAREIQSSIKESVHQLLCDRIKYLGLEDCYIIQKDCIMSACGALFIFKGLFRNINKIKSIEGIDICWIEEAETISQDSWDILVPTIRKNNSEIWISFNQESDKSAMYKEFIENQRPNSTVEHMTWRDNKMCPDVLIEEMEHCRKTDPDKFEHVWEGGLKKYSDAIIFAGKIQELDFVTPQCVVHHYGCDWGFSGDPMAIVSMFMLSHDLYIDCEFYAHGIDYDEYEESFDTVPGIRSGRIRADNAYPASISYVKKKGFDIIGAKKGPGSVEDGIKYLRGFRTIFIHPRCKGALDDFKNYRYKQDPLTKEILPIIVDKANHVPDAIRYALEPLIKLTEEWGAV